MKAQSRERNEHQTERETQHETGTVAFERDLSAEPATEAFGAAIGRLLRPGDVVTLQGGLGAGKTTLTRAIAQGAGVGADQGVSSPTFVIVQEYAAETDPAERALERLVHVDAYRLGGEDELDTIGWDRFERGGLATLRAAMVCEWAERIPHSVRALGPAMQIELDITGERARQATVRVPEAWSDRPTFDALVTREPTRCRKTGAWVEPDNPHWPFADERAQMADLYGWFSGSYKVSRDVRDSDLEETE